MSSSALAKPSSPEDIIRSAERRCVKTVLDKLEKEDCLTPEIRKYILDAIGDFMRTVLDAGRVA